MNYLELNVKESSACQNLCTTNKAVPRGKFIALNTSIRKQERLKTNELCIQIWRGKKKPVAKTQINKKEIIKIRAEINEIKNTNSGLPWWRSG